MGRCLLCSCNLDVGDSLPCHRGALGAAGDWGTCPQQACSSLSMNWCQKMATRVCTVAFGL